LLGIREQFRKGVIIVNNASVMLTASMLFVLLVSAVVALPELAGAQGDSLDAKRQESAFACNRLALTSEQRKRHFDELGPKLRSLKMSVRELPNGYEFEFPADPNRYNSLRNGQSASVPAARSSTLTCGWSAKAGRSGLV
jgi:hypothetical protein